MLIHPLDAGPVPIGQIGQQAHPQHPVGCCGRLAHGNGAGGVQPDHDAAECRVVMVEPTRRVAMKKTALLALPGASWRPMPTTPAQ